MAGSGPSAYAIKGDLQGFSGVIVITRNEGVRGSNPRVGFAKVLLTPIEKLVGRETLTLLC